MFFVRRGGGAGRVAGSAENAGLLGSKPCQRRWAVVGTRGADGEFAQFPQFPLPLAGGAPTQSAAFAGAGSDGRRTPPRVKIASISLAL